jgi:pimeloyl-ACP methyl ester carboxylesterase
MATSKFPSSFLPALPELRTASFFGRNIRYYDVGSGPPLVLIHGIGGDADEWVFCFKSLGASHRVIALDLLGFGRSDKPAIEYCIAVFVEVLEHFLSALKIPRASLVGSSLGGWIAAAFALQFPDRVDKLVLVDAAGVWDGPTNLPIDLHVSTFAHMRHVMERVLHDKSLATDELVELSYRQHLERGDGYTIDRVLKNLRDGHERLDDTIGQLSMPVLLIWGEQDEMIPLGNGRLMQRLIPGSRLDVIPQCGHLPAFEKPIEFTNCVLNFLGQ